MYLNFILEYFEIIVISSLLTITISTICILFIQNNFIKKTSNKIDNYHSIIKKNNSELAEYINTLSKITELNKQKMEELISDTSDIGKNLSNIKASKGDDDILTGLHDSEIETIYTYHKNVKN